MKLNLIFISLILSSFLFSCSEDEPTELTKTIEVSSLFELTVPVSVELQQIQGTDTYVAELIDKTDDTFRIFMDIGFLAGSFVDQDSQSAQQRSSTNRAFWFEAKDSEWEDFENCCLFYTFPELGPANFVTSDDVHRDVVDAIMVSLRAL